MSPLRQTCPTSVFRLGSIKCFSKYSLKSCEKPKFAARRYPVPSRRKINAFSASHRRAADSTSVSSTACRSKVERLTTLSTSAVAVCCSAIHAARSVGGYSRHEVRLIENDAGPWDAMKTLGILGKEIIIYDHPTRIGLSPHGRPLRSIDVSLSYNNFEDFWHSQVPPFTPNGKAIAALRETKLVEAVRAILPSDPDGSIAYSARANAVKGRTPE